MNNEELIEAARYCFNHEERQYYHKWIDVEDCQTIPFEDAMEALETADKRIAKLEAISKTVIPHRNYERCHIYWCECGWFLRNKDQTPNYCPNCGKRIEWENEE